MKTNVRGNRDFDTGIETDKPVSFVNINFSLPLLQT